MAALFDGAADCESELLSVPDPQPATNSAITPTPDANNRREFMSGKRSPGCLEEAGLHVTVRVIFETEPNNFPVGLGLDPPFRTQSIDELYSPTRLIPQIDFV